MRVPMLIAAMLVLASTVASPGSETPYAGPYAGQDRRDIKALSTAQLRDIADSRGMGMALPAELNGYPGPSHVLELADKLWLGVDQRVRTEALFQAMKHEARVAGAAFVEREA